LLWITGGRVAGRLRRVPRRLLRRVAGLGLLRIPLLRLLRIPRLLLLRILRLGLTLRRRVVAGSLRLGLPGLPGLPGWLLAHEVPFPVATTRSHRRRSTGERGRWCPERSVPQTAAASAGDGEDNGAEWQRRPQQPGLLPIRGQ
jgi:hypothetical protein